MVCIKYYGSGFMNFNPNFPLPMIPMENNMINQVINKLNEYDNRIKTLEERISKLEGLTKNSNSEPDNSFYMI